MATRPGSAPMYQPRARAPERTMLTAVSLVLGVALCLVAREQVPGKAAVAWAFLLAVWSTVLLLLDASAYLNDRVEEFVRRRMGLSIDMTRWVMRVMGLHWGVTAFLFLPYLARPQQLVLALVVLVNFSVMVRSLTMVRSDAHVLDYPSAVLYAAITPFYLEQLGVAALLLVWCCIVLLLTSYHSQRAGFKLRHDLALSNAELYSKLSVANEALREVSVAKTRLLATASHDLRQPVHSLGILVSELRRDPAAFIGDGGAGRLMVVVDGLSDSLNVLLSAARLEAGVVKVDVREFSLGELVRNLRVEFSPAAAVKRLALRFEVRDLLIRSDEQLLASVLRNLVSNAVRYTDAGMVTLSASPCGDQLHIVVADTGKGIAAERLALLFEEQKQISYLDRMRGGTGLGLSIVKRYAQLMGMQVWVESEAGVGSRFFVLLPKTAWEPAIDQALAEPAQPDSLRGVRALTFDDDPIILRSMAGLLGGWECVAICVDNPAVWLQQASRQAMLDIDIVIADYHLGASNPNGLDIIKRIRSLCQRDLPAVLITGDVNPALEEEARRCGIVLLHKPIRPSRLRDLLVKAVAA